MPSPDQLAGLAVYRKARSQLADLERAQLDALTDVAQLGAALDGALGDGRDEEADAIAVELRQAQTRRDQADAARARAAAALASGRARAIAKGAGFDLLSAAHPLLLLPVRLETRFAWEDAKGSWTFVPDPAARRALLVRVFPDEVHEDAHEPELTPAETELLAELDKRLRAARDLRDLDAAWTDAARRTGPTRAGWLGELIARAAGFTRRPGRLSRPSVARLLPDRWVAFAQLDDGSVLTGQSALVSEPLETGPSPDGMAWMTNFDAALAAGMALVVPDLPPAVAEVQRLTVVGARGTLDPDEGATGLQDLLDAHHYTDGLALLAPGTATNSVPGARAGSTTRPRPEDVVALERRRFMIGMRAQPLCQPGDDSDGSHLAGLLGIDAQKLAYVDRADATTRREGIVLRRLLAIATDRQLARLLSDGVLDGAQLDEALGYAVEFVSATGPAPALRVGSQPYGILPVLLRDDARVAPGSFAARALPVLDALRAHWAQAADGLAWIGNAGPDPGATIVRMLQRDAVARSILFRPLLGPELAGEALGARVPRATAAARSAAAAALGGVGAANAAGSRLLEALHMTFAAPLTAPVIEPRLAAALELVAALRPDLLARGEYGAGQEPRSLLFAIARLAMLERVDRLARAAHIAAGADPSGWDDETVASAFADALGSPLRRLEAPDPVDPIETTAFHLSEQGRDAGACADLRQDLRWLKSRPTDVLDEQLRASLGLFGHRLDPWYTALATERLQVLRNSPATERGIGIGGYGVVEHIRQSPRRRVAATPPEFTDPFNGGFIHAPSANHGATASVLRSVHLAHAAAGNGDAFSIDLSSARVRTALELLDGIRAGQPLAALLGYRIERLLAREGLQRLIAPLRGAAPLVAHHLTPGTQPAGEVAASTVCDGLTALADAGYTERRSPTAKLLVAHHPAVGPLSTSERHALDRVLQETADALDAVADLLLAEGVHQAVAGNPVRSGAAVDGLAGGAPPAPDPSVIAAPRTGVGVTHRLVVLLGDPDDAPAGWVDTPRALAEPRLEAWARAALPAPEHIVLRVRFVDDDGVELATLDHLDLAMLNGAETATPPVSLGVAALDLVLQADPHEQPQAAPLELRLAALVEQVRPAAVGDARLELVMDRHAGWGDDDFGLLETLEIARQLHSTLGRGRALKPHDLSPLDAAIPVDPAGAAELAARASAAAAGLALAGSALSAVLTSTDAGELRGALFAVDRFGVPGAAPLTLRDPAGSSDSAVAERARRLAALQQQAATVHAEVQRRVDSAGAMPAADAVGRLAAIFGEAFIALPALDTTGALLASFDAVPDGAEPPAVRAWLARAARVREAVAALDATLAYADARSAVDVAAPVAALRVAQLGGPQGERWVALAPAAGGAIPGGRISCVAVAPSGALPSSVVAGLLLDEWVEVVPSAEVTTSVAFHYHAPGATAPQALLLGVPPAGREAWTPADARAIVHEALELARLRLVELDDLKGLGQLLPAFVTAENPDGDEIGLDVEILTEPGQ